MSAAPAAGLSGKWTIVADANGQQVDVIAEIKQTGADFTGTTLSHLGNGTIDGGKVSGKTVAATLHAEIEGQPVDFAMEGTVDGDKMTGTFSNPAFGQIPFTGTRSK